jgi:hypothetical protein
MEHFKRSKTITAITIMIAALALGATWLIAAANAPEATPVVEAAEQVSGSTQTPLPDFQPSEDLPAGSAVAFPTDI